MPNSICINPIFLFLTQLFYLAQKYNKTTIPTIISPRKKKEWLFLPHFCGIVYRIFGLPKKNQNSFPVFANCRILATSNYME